jgi:tetratricopeptide (TPR) repeat protein
MVPFGRNEHFVGRQAILEQLLKRIPPDTNYDTCQRTALEGLGGTGKTQIALEAIYLLRNQDPACSIFWISASDLTSFENSYYDIGRILQIPGSKDIQVDIKPLVKAALSQEKRAGKWLLVIDNADDSDLLFRGPSLAQFLPFSRNGSILFTTRNHQSAVRLGAMTIKVGSMDMQEAHELLSLGVEPGLVKNENDDSTRELLDVLTYLPLAISQASAYLNKNQVTSTQYLQVLHSNDDDMIHLLSEDFGAHGRYNSDHNPVTSTFFISFDQLRRSNKLAAEYLQLISFLNEIDIPYAILPSAGGKAKMMEAVGGLKAFAFIRQRHDDSFDIHRLVQVSVRRWVMINGVWGNTLKVAINRLNDVLPIPEHQTRDAWARYLPHVLSVLNLAREREGEDYPNRSQLMSKTGTWLSKMGKYGGAEAMFQEVLVTQTRDLGAEHPETFLTMNNIGAIFFQEGKFEEATSMLTQVLAMRKKILGDNHPDVLSSMNNLASTLEGTGKLNEAMMLQEEVLEKRRRILGTEHPSTLLAMSNLASTLKRTGKLDEAMILQEEVLNKRRRILGAEHPETLLTMNNIGVIFFQEGKFEEATSMLTQVLAMRKKILGDNHPDVLSSMNNFASTLKRTGKLDEAMMLQEEVLNKRRRILGAEHPSTLSAMSDLASMLENIGRLDEAMMLQEEVLNKRRRILGAEHPSTLSAMSNLAKLWFRQGKIEEAVAISREALKKKRKIFGDDHREVISAMDSHALMLRAQGRVEEAEEMQREAGNRMRRVLGHEHPDTATATPDISSTGAEQSKAEQEVEVRAETYS